MNRIRQSSKIKHTKSNLPKINLKENQSFQDNQTKNFRWLQILKTEKIRWNDKIFVECKYKESNLIIHLIGSIYLKDKINNMITS